ncbi:MAG: CoA transferase [Marinosulfonomonas sp.]|nr:CoA transferase [Marinosulfonomonas sp.]
MTRPLDDIFVLDFSTLLPGPLATLMLAEAGAEVVKLERPGTGEDMRRFEPKLDAKSLGYTLLNRGKKSIALDLKEAGSVEALRPLIEKADVIVEQFRPGVMERLGLGYEAVRKMNPDIIYCSITGYGQSGPKSLVAGHDMNYLGDAGVLSISSGPVDNPTVPPALMADVGGGTYPAVVNILLALRNRDRTGEGAHLDIAMAEGVFAFAYWAYAQGVVLEQPVPNGAARLTGAVPRYRMYPTSDGKLAAVACIEQKFWDAFCDVIDMPANLRDDSRDPAACIAEISRRVLVHDAAHWEKLFKAADCCCTIVKDLSQAAQDPHFQERGVFDWKVGMGDREIQALVLPIAAEFRGAKEEPVSAPALGENNSDYGVTDPS